MGGNGTGNVSMELDGQKNAAIPTNVLKSVLIVSLLAITLLASLVPFALRRAAINHQTSSRRRHIFAGIFSLLSCFGGGVFLATCLLDLFPDTRELISDGLDVLEVKSAFPLSEFLVAIGFFLVLFIEQIVLWFRERQPVKRHDRLISEPNAEERPTSPARVRRRRRTVPAARHSNDGPLGTIVNIPTSHDHRQHHHTKRRVPPNSDDGQRVEVKSGAHSSQEPLLQVDDAAPVDSPITPAINSEIDSSIIVPDVASDDNDSMDGDIHFDPESHSTFRALMLVMALSCHATFEGLALGLQTEPSVALQIFGALCIHKFVIAFSLGMRLVQSRLSTLSIVGCCLLFCVSALVGGFIGVAISEGYKSSSAKLINGCLQGLACGTFLYITAFEILPHELNEPGHRLSKLIMLLLGFTIICIFVYFYPND